MNRKKKEQFFKALEYDIEQTDILEEYERHQRRKEKIKKILDWLECGFYMTIVVGIWLYIVDQLLR